MELKAKIFDNFYGLRFWKSNKSMNEMTKPFKQDFGAFIVNVFLEPDANNKYGFGPTQLLCQVHITITANDETCPRFRRLYEEQRVTKRPERDSGGRITCPDANQFMVSVHVFTDW